MGYFRCFCFTIPSYYNELELCHLKAFNICSSLLWYSNFFALLKFIKYSSFLQEWNPNQLQEGETFYLIFKALYILLPFSYALDYQQTKSL